MTAGLPRTSGGVGGSGCTVPADELPGFEDELPGFDRVSLPAYVPVLEAAEGGGG